MQMTNSVINIVAVLQSRMNPQKLPHKAILSLGGKPLLLMTVERIKACKLINMIAVSLLMKQLMTRFINYAKGKASRYSETEEKTSSILIIKLL
jgi:spore coat polysaccharide biosynthesis protein SpsF (cytidylyltransferase family)